MTTKVYLIYRRMDGFLEYLAQNRVHWTRNASEAANFKTRDEAVKVRTEIAGPSPQREYGTYPHITS